MTQWWQLNKDWIGWVFSGIGVTILVGLFKIFKKKKKDINEKVSNSNNQSNNQTVTQTVNIDTKDPIIKPKKHLSDEERKKITNVLFVDDDTSFKVVDILKKSGWENTEIKNILSINDPTLKKAHICFVDIQGVLPDLFPNREGLGLVDALKEKYPDKKIVVYSAEKIGDRFDTSLEKADARLPKDAVPYQFESLIDNFSKDIF